MKKSLRHQVLRSLTRIERQYEKAIAEAKKRRDTFESKILKKLRPKPPSRRPKKK